MKFRGFLFSLAINVIKFNIIGTRDLIKRLFAVCWRRRLIFVSAY